MTVSEASARQQPISLFSVYAPEDAALYQQLEKHLSSLKRQRVISMRSLDTIAAGADRDGEIERYLEEAQIILILISADFINSTNCYDIMTRVLQRHREDHNYVVPIRMRPVDVKNLAISDLPVLPLNERPVTEWLNCDKAFSHIAKEIRQKVVTLLNPVPVVNSWAGTEAHRSYLSWLMKRTSSLDTRGLSSTQRPVQVRLEEVYIALEVRDEDMTQEAETSSHTQSSISLSSIVSQYDHLVLLGGPGSGKSTCLQYLAFKHAQALYGDVDTEVGDARFPILLRVADYVEYGMHHVALSDYIANDCIRHECPAPELADMVKAALQAGRCLILLDGLDEVVRADDRQRVVRSLEEFIRCYDDVPNRFIITSRSAGYNEASLSNTFAHYALQEMEETQIRQFLASWYPTTETARFPQEAAVTREKRSRHEIASLMTVIQTVPGVRRLAANPLQLDILAQLHRTGASLPSRRVELYNQVTEALTHTWRSAQGVPPSIVSEVSPLFGQPHITYLLSRLAYWLHKKKPGGFAREREVCRELGREWTRLTDKVWHEENPDIEKVVKQFLRAVREQTGILVEDAPHHYGFVHLTFEEYYAAHYLVANSQKRAQRIRTHLHDPRWQEPILLALGLIGMESEEETHMLVETAILAGGEEARAERLDSSPHEALLSRDYLFALRCLGDDIPVDRTLAEQLIERLLRELTQQEGSGKFQKYQEALAEGLGYVERSVYASLLIPHLTKNLESTNRSLRLWSLYSLGRIGQSSAPDEVRTLLLKMLHDDDSDLRSAALWGLSQIPGTEITDTLLKILRNDEEAYVRQNAVKYLGERRDTSLQVRQALLDALHETRAPNSILLRHAAIESLGQLGDASPEIVSSLIMLLSRDILKASDHSILKSLRQLSYSSPAVVPMVVNALRDAAPRVRISVAQVLETFDHTSSEALTALRDIPPQTSSISIFQAPFCFKQWYWLPDEVEALLLYELRSSRPGVRWDAMKTLERWEELSERAEEALLAILQDENVTMRTRAIETLNAFEMSSKVFNVFMDVLFNDTNVYVRACIVKCLGDINWPLEEIVPALLQAMHDSDDHVRCCAVESLGKIIPILPEVMDAFISALLNDPYFGVRWEVVKTLQRLETLPEIALTAVLQALTDQHSAVRWDCALLLGQGSASDERTLQLLLHGLSDTDRNVRAACSQALVQLGQRFPEYVETIAEGLTQIIQEADNTASHFAEYGSTYDGAYNALWLLEVQNTFEAI